MYGILLCLSTVCYSGEIAKLDNRDYRTREASFKILKSANPHLVRYAVANELATTESPEKLWRLEKLLMKHNKFLSEAKALILYSMVNVDDVDDRIFMNEELTVALCDLIDKNKIWKTENSLYWARHPPYRTNCSEGDVLYVLRYVVNERNKSAILFGGVIAPIYEYK